MLQVGDRVLVVKGCADRGVRKNTYGEIVSLQEMERREVKLTLLYCGQRMSFYVRHANRLADPDVRMNTGDPHQNIVLSKAIARKKAAAKD